MQLPPTTCQSSVLLQLLNLELSKPRCSKKCDKILERLGRLRERYSLINHHYDITVTNAPDGKARAPLPGSAMRRMIRAMPERATMSGRTYEWNGKVSQGLFFAEAPIAGRWNTAGFSQSRHLIFQRLVCCGGPCVPYLRMTHSLTVRNILQKTFVSHICFAKSFPCFSYEGTLLTSAP